jgi:hypothetical protein
VLQLHVSVAVHEPFPEQTVGSVETIPKQEIEGAGVAGTYCLINDLKELTLV